MTDFKLPEGADPIVGLHYRLYAYICGKACIRHAPDAAPRTFTTIFNERPNECRFAVVQRIPLIKVGPDGPSQTVRYDNPTGPFVVWDLFDEELTRGRRTGPGGFMSPPPAWYLGPTESAATMKALALYDKETSDG